MFHAPFGKPLDKEKLKELRSGKTRTMKEDRACPYCGMHVCWCSEKNPSPPLAKRFS